MTWQLTINGQDVTVAALWQATITAGRDDIDSQPDATVMSVTLTRWEPAGRVGDPVALGDERGRVFAGSITDLQTRLEPFGDVVYWQTQLTASGPLADLGRVFVGDEPWPAETDSQRVDRILTAAAAAHAVDPGILGPQILPRDIDHQDALNLAQTVADDALGVVWEQPSDPDTPIRYLPSRLRTWDTAVPTWAELDPTLTWATLDPATTWEGWGGVSLPGDPGYLTLDAATVAASPCTWSQRVGDLVRTVRVVYGPEVDTGQRTEVVLGSGLPEQRRDTQLADSTGATQVADSVLRSHREPAWRLTGVVVDRAHVEAGKWAEVRRALAVGTRLTIEGIALRPPTGPAWQGYLEGWVHRLDAGSHVVELRTSERALTEPADRWVDFNTALTWSAIGPAVTWGDLADIPA